MPQTPGTKEQTIATQPNFVHELWRHGLWIIGTAVFAGLIALGVAMLQPTLYEANGTVFLNDPRNSGSVASELGFAPELDRHLNSQANLMESLPVASRAAEILADGTTASEVGDAVAADPAIDISAVTIRTTMPTADRAVATQGAVVQAYEEIVTQQVQDTSESVIAVLEQSVVEAEARITELDSLIADDPANSVLEGRQSAAVGQLVALDTRVEQLTIGAALYGSGVRLYTPAATPTSPVQPKPLLYVAVAFVLGALAASVWVWWSTSDQ